MKVGLFLMFLIMYHPVVLKLKNVLLEIHLLLTPKKEHGKVLEKVPIIGFRWTKNLKVILVRAKEATFEKKKGCCRSCQGTRCDICKHVVTTKTIRSFSTQREYDIKPNNPNCHSSNVVYHAQNNRSSTESFQSRFKNFKSAHWSFIKGNTVKQASFHTHFEDNEHGMSDWKWPSLRV